MVFENSPSDHETWSIWCHVDFTSIFHSPTPLVPQAWLSLFHQWECWKCNGHGLSVSCVKWPLVLQHAQLLNDESTQSICTPRLALEKDDAHFVTQFRATSHMSQGPWPCNGEDPWLSSKGCTTGVGKAVLCSYGPSSIVWSENGPCCRIFSYFVGGKKRGGFGLIYYVSNSINLRESLGGVCLSRNMFWNMSYNMPCCENQ